MAFISKLLSVCVALGSVCHRQLSAAALELRAGRHGDAPRFTQEEFRRLAPQTYRFRAGLGVRRNHYHVINVAGHDHFAYVGLRIDPDFDKLTQQEYVEWKRAVQAEEYHIDETLTLSANLDSRGGLMYGGKGEEGVPMKIGGIDCKVFVTAHVYGSEDWAAAAFRVGDYVIVNGTGQPEYDGQPGKIVAQKDDRWAVELNSGASPVFQAINLKK